MGKENAAKRVKWIYYTVAELLYLVYLARKATGLLFLALLTILPVGFWVIWNINPDTPATS